MKLEITQLRSNGDFLAILDVDDWWEPKKLSLQVPDLRMKPLVWCVEIMRFSTKNQIGVDTMERSEAKWIYTP